MGCQGVVLPIIKWKVDQFNCRIAVALQREHTAGAAVMSGADSLLPCHRSLPESVDAGGRAGEEENQGKKIMSVFRVKAVNRF